MNSAYNFISFISRVRLPFFRFTHSLRSSEFIDCNRLSEAASVYLCPAGIQVVWKTLPHFVIVLRLWRCCLSFSLAARPFPSVSMRILSALAGEKTPLLLPLWTSGSVHDSGLYWGKHNACTYPGQVPPGLMNPGFLARSLCDWLELDPRALDWLNWAQPLIVDGQLLLFVQRASEFEINSALCVLQLFHYNQQQQRLIAAADCSGTVIIMHNGPKARKKKSLPQKLLFLLCAHTQGKCEVVAKTTTSLQPLGGAICVAAVTFVKSLKSLYLSHDIFLFILSCPWAQQTRWLLSHNYIQLPVEHTPPTGWRTFMKNERKLCLYCHQTTNNCFTREY